MNEKIKKRKKEWHGENQGRKKKGGRKIQMNE